MLLHALAQCNELGMANGLSLIPKADAHTNVRYRGASSAGVGQLRTVGVRTRKRPFGRTVDPRQQSRRDLRCLVGGGDQRVEFGVADFGKGRDNAIKVGVHRAIGHRDSLMEEHPGSIFASTIFTVAGFHKKWTIDLIRYFHMVRYMLAPNLRTGYLAARSTSRLQGTR